MTLKGKTNHYNIKFLKGYGFYISVKNSKIILKNTSDPFKDPEIEQWFVNNMPYAKIVMSGKGNVSTEAFSLIYQHNRNLIFPNRHNIFDDINGTSQSNAKIYYPPFFQYI